MYFAHGSGAQRCPTSNFPNISPCPQPWAPHAGKLPIFFPSGKDPQPPPHQVTSKANWLAWKEGERSLSSKLPCLRGTSLSMTYSESSECDLWAWGYLCPLFSEKKSQTGWWKHVHHNFLLNSDYKKCHFSFSPPFFPVHPGLATGTPTKKSEK